MAEIVEYRQERMLPEYEEMKKQNLFTDSEIRQIIKKRETYEYKIERQNKALRDICEYITYERGLVNLIAERNKNHNMQQKKCNIEHSILNHMKSLYRTGLSKFPENLNMWISFIKFCAAFKFIPEGTTAFDKMIQFHADKPDVWLKAVMFEYNETHNMDRVKDLIFRGLQRHPTNSDLYKKFFKIVLDEAANMSSELLLQGNTQSEQAIGLERAVIVYESSKKRIRDIRFMIELLEIAQRYPFARTLQKQLLEDMMETFPRDEILWDALAQRELAGIHTCDYMENQPPVQRTLKRQIELCVDVYEAAVDELKTEKMWSLYINAMLQINQDVSTQQVFKRQILGKAFKSAHEAERMSENHYLHYIEILLESEIEQEYILSVMQKATIMHSGSVKLWELWMRYHIQLDEEKIIYEVFRKAVKKLAFESYPLYKVLIQYYQTRPDLPTKLEDIMKEAVQNTSPLFAQFKPQYIEWIAVTKTMNAARKAYMELVTNTPPCLELHQKMAVLESMQLKPDIKAWRRCHEYATQFFGKKRTDIWIDYIKFERDHGESKNMGLLNERAKATLNPDIVDNFISEHCFLMTGTV